MLRAMGPWTPKVVSPTARVSDATTPGVGRIELTPQNAAGVRRLPPVSEPVHRGAMPVAKATAEPPDEPAQVPRPIEGVARRAVDLVHRVGARPELGRVGLADDDRAGAAQGRDQSLVVVRYVVLVYERAEGRAQPLGEVEVLHAQGQPMQGPQGFAPHHGVLRGPRLLARAGIAGRHHRVHGGVHRVDAGDAGVEQFDRRQRLPADQPPGLDRAQVAGFGHRPGRTRMLVGGKGFCGNPWSFIAGS